VPHSLLGDLSNCNLVLSVVQYKHLRVSWCLCLTDWEISVFISDVRVYNLSGKSFYTVGDSFVDVGVSLSDWTSVVFQLKSAANAHVALTADRLNFTDDHMYEIVFGVGGTSNTIIRCSLHLHKQ